MLLTEDGAFALFFRPHSGGFDRSRVPTPYGLCPGVRGGGGGGGGGAPECSWNSLMHIKKAESFFGTVACCYSPSKQKTENGEIDLWKHLYCYCLSFLRLKMKR